MSTSNPTVVGANLKTVGLMGLFCGLLLITTNPSSFLPANELRDNREYSIRSLQWVNQYETNFPFSMQNTEKCARYLDDPTVLDRVAKAAVKDWKRRGNKKMSQEMERASAVWKEAMQACHGPIPSSIEAKLSLRAFTEGAAKCGDSKNRDKAEGEWCFEGWGDHFQNAFGSFWGSRKAPALLVDAARCALHLEFPLERTPQLTDTPFIPPQKRPTDWKPKRTILVTLTMGPKGGPMGCKLVTTAYPRGWEVILVEGDFQRLAYKYAYALKALKMTLDADPTVPVQDTLVVFADAKDMLVQEPPEHIVHSFLQQPLDFLFSAEPTCFPLWSWPHSVGVKQITCNQLFPRATGDKVVMEGPMYANTGGWIGRASSALVVLKEMAIATQHRPKEHNCHERGTDQLLGNAAYLRHSALIGLDYNERIFASNGWGLLNHQFLTYNPQTRAYCMPKAPETCPGMIHFNGGGDEGSFLQVGLEALTSAESLPTCGNRGSVTVVDITAGTVRVLADDKGTTNFGSEWDTCLQDKACFGGP